MSLLISLSGTGRIPDQLVILDMKHGVEAKNYEEVCITPTNEEGVTLRAVRFVWPNQANGLHYAQKFEVFSAVMWQPATIRVMQKVIVTDLNNNSGCDYSQWTEPAIYMAVCWYGTEFSHAISILGAEDIQTIL